MKRIGERIKRKREQLNLQLNDLAHRVGISASALSQIEKARTFPTIVTLKAIAENLHTTVGELIGENEALTNNPVIPKQAISLVIRNDSGTAVYLLSEQDASKQMDTFLIRFSPASGIEGLFSKIFGHVFCHTVYGEVRLDLDGKTYILKQGDSAYFNSKRSFDLVNNHNGVSELIWVQSPPNQ